jgi:hypothetical protein
MDDRFRREALARETRRTRALGHVAREHARRTVQCARDARVRSNETKRRSLAFVQGLERGPRVAP